MSDRIAELEAEVARLTAILNTPILSPFVEAAVAEAQHQIYTREKNDKLKNPYDWFWLIGYLAGKAAASHVAGDYEKAQHHTITTAAALANWYRRVVEDKEAAST